MEIAIIAAKSKNNVIGNDNKLIWHLPADLKRFKELTSNTAVIMGRKTYESIGRPLPNRLNIIITRKENYQATGCIVVNSIAAAIKKCIDYPKVFIIGGEQIYRQSLNMGLVDLMYITEIDEEFEGDAFFPGEDEYFWRNYEETVCELHPADDVNKYDYKYITYRNIN